MEGDGVHQNVLKLIIKPGQILVVIKKNLMEHRSAMSTVKTIKIFIS